MKVVGVVILFHPAEDKLRCQFEGLASQLDHLIYIDNSYGDGLSFLPTTSDITYIQNPKNYGIAVAQNQGIERARELGATHVLLMDQDSIPSKDCIKYLIEPFKKTDKKIAAVGANIINAYAPESVTYGVKIKGFRLEKVPLSTNYTNVSYVIASGCLILMSALDKVGGMREELFIDGVDFEWCLRAKSKGYEILQSSQAKLVHELGNGIKDKVLSHSLAREYYIVRNALIIARLPYIPFRYRVRRITMSVFRVFSNLRPSHIKYFESGLKGLKDGVCKS